MDKFIDFIITKEKYLCLWYMTMQGELQLVKLYYKDGGWEYHAKNGINTKLTRYTTEQMRKKLGIMLLDYNIEWEDCIKGKHPIKLSFKYHHNGVNVLVDFDDNRPPITKQKIDRNLSRKEQEKLKKLMKDTYIEDMKKYTRIVKSVVEEIRLANPEKAEKINLVFDENTIPVNFADCKLSDLKTVKSLQETYTKK